MTRQTETTPAPRSPRALRLRIVGLLLAAIAAIEGATLGADILRAEAQIQAGIAREARLFGDLLIEMEGASVRFGRPEKIEARAHTLIEEAGGALVSVIVFDASGDPLVTLPENAPAPAPDLRASVTAEGGARYLEDRNLYLGSIPFGPEGSVIGLVAMQWSEAPARARFFAELKAKIAFDLALAALIGLGAYLALGHFLFRPFQALSDAVGRILGGAREALPGCDRRDEIGAIARSLDGIQAQMDGATAFRTALESASTAIALTDAGFRLTFTNDAFATVMRRTADHWRAKLPNFDPEHLTGTHLDAFHADPERSRALLSALTGPHEAEIKFGGFVAGLAVTPIDTLDGTRLGYMLQWTDRTVERAAEEQIAHVLAAVAEGDFSRRIDLAIDHRFMRSVAEAMNRVCADVDAFLADVEQTLAALASGDLRQEVSGAYRGRLGTIAGQVNETVAALDSLVGAVKAAAEDISENIEEIAQGASELSAQAESQAAAIEETSAAMQEIAATVRENAGSAANADTLAASASERAEQGRAVVADTVAAMTNIRQSAGQIADIISVIDSIAFQTNLLALNAAVEAARAGDAGKGFAVVASEVGTLAQRSSEAAKDIKALIDKSAGHVEQGDRLVAATDSALSEIRAGVQSAAEMINQIAQASREQTVGVQESSAAVAEMDRMTQQFANLSEQSATAAEALSRQKSTLTDLVSRFRLKPGAALRAQGAVNLEPPSASAPARLDETPRRLSAAL